MKFMKLPVELEFVEGAHKRFVTTYINLNIETISSYMESPDGSWALINTAGGDTIKTHITLKEFEKRLVLALADKSVNLLDTIMYGERIEEKK